MQHERSSARASWRQMAIPLALAVLTAGCAWLPRGRSGEGIGDRVGWKMVMEKVPPSYLIAVDRSECVVSTKRFEKVETGKQVFCAWRASGLAGSRLRERDGFGASPVPGSERVAEEERRGTAPRRPPGGD